jgi:hypothetical protein
MLKISIDLGNVPSVLQALANERVAQDVVNAAAESYLDDTLDWIKAGRAFTKREGQLEQSIGVRYLSGGVAEVYANAEYAACVEYGTRPHVINAKNGKALKIPSAGGFVFRRSVSHPGSRPFPYFYTDSDNRMQHMKEAGLLVLARIMNE